MIQPNTPMVRQQLHDLVDLANSKAYLAHGPFRLLDTTGLGRFSDWLPPYVVTDRGGWNKDTVYQPGDQVGQNGYLFINVADDNSNTPPLDLVTGIPTSFVWWEPWQSCYKRVRDELFKATNGFNQKQFPLATFQQAVSGPWPCQLPDINYNDLAFYFADTGKQESVTVHGGGLINVEAQDVHYTDADSATFFAGQFQSPVPITHFPAIQTDDGMGGGTEKAITLVDPDNGEGQYRIRFVDSATFEITVGGTLPLPLTATFSVGCGTVRGWSHQNIGAGVEDAGFSFVGNVFSNVDPTTLVNVDGSEWFPGAVFTASPFGGWGEASPPLEIPQTGGVVFTSQVSGVFLPGTYRVTFSTTSGPNNKADGQLTFTNRFDPDDFSNHLTITGTEEWSNDTYVSIGTGIVSTNVSIDFVSNQNIETPAIHDTKKVFKIPVSNFNGAGFPPGLTGARGHFQFDINGLDYINTPPFSQIGSTLASGGPANVLPRSQWVNPPFSGDPNHLFDEYLPLTGWTINPSTDGFWFGKTPPINSLGIRPYAQMPWNQFPVSFWVPSEPVSANSYLGWAAPFVGSTRAYDFFDAPNWVAATSDHELLPWPKRWKPGVRYPINNWSIIDSNGNLQQCVGDGTSGQVEPAWTFNKGDITIEPDTVVPHGIAHGVHWKLIKVLRPAPNRLGNTAYPVGSKIIDGNCNEQTSVSGWEANNGYPAGWPLIDSNNNLQMAEAAGDSGDNMPAWKTNLGEETADGTITWRLTQLNAPPISDAHLGVAQITWGTHLGDVTQDGTVFWKLTKINPKLSPAVARTTPPIYPFYWDNEPGGANLPTLVDPLINPNVHTTVFPQPPPPFHPFSFAPQGWWIYRVALNRIPQTKTTAAPPKDPIAVKLGCRRNGVFVSFGTYQTGEIIDAMWPIFTNTALAYQASERVDVQAEIITCGVHYGTWGAVDYPMAAAYMNDVTAILNLIP